jgi:class 3 adenylate cyclase
MQKAPEPQAFLFADVVDSTGLERRAARVLSDGLPVMDRVEAVFASVAAEHGGRYYFREGDRFQAIFPKVVNAAIAAERIIARLKAGLNPEGSEPRLVVNLRMGLNYGAASPVVPATAKSTDADPAVPAPDHPGEPLKEDYTGPAVTLTARLMDLARPSQVLMSLAAVTALNEPCPEHGTSLRPAQTPVPDIGGLAPPSPQSGAHTVAPDDRNERRGDGSRPRAPLRARYIGRYRLQGIGWHRVYALRGSNLRLETRPPLPLNPIGTPLISRTALTLFVITAACLTIAQNSWRWQVPESASITSAGILQTFNKKGNLLLRLPIENIYYEVFRRKKVAHPPPFRLIPSFYPAREPGKFSRVIDLNGDGRKEIVVSVVGARGENQATSIIAALSHTGNLLWWWMPDRKVITGSRSFPDSLSTEFVDISDLDGDGDPEILLTAYNYPDWAEGLYVLSHKGAPLCEWWNSGAIVPVPADLDEDGIKEIIVAGVNNEPGLSPYGDAIVAILKWKTFRIGSSPQKTEDYKIKGIPEGGHSLYIHLPPADTGLLFQHFDFARVSAVTENEVTIEMNTLVGPRDTDLAQIYFTFDHSFRLQRITPADNYKPVHTALYRAGKLKRSWQAMVAEMTKTLQAPPDL